MKVILAESAGFCAGVKKAMRIAIDAAGEYGGVRSVGPVIHNNQAVRLLELRGVRTSDDEPEPGERILVRAHGVHPADRAAWEARGCRLIDATCVHVSANQKLAARAAAAGKTVVVAGDIGHPEVGAVMGSAGPTALAVADAAAAGRIQPTSPLFLLAQTTFEPEAFDEIAAVLAGRFPDVEIKNTICAATHRRQEEARRLASEVDALVVVGGRHSANTRRLAEAGKAADKPVFLVETEAELDPEDFRRFLRVGVTAGASTPGWITQAVVEKLERMGGGGTPWRLARFLLNSRILTALSAFGLALAAQRLACLPFNMRLAAAAGLYVFFAHIVNRRVPGNPGLRQFSGIDPFYSRHRILLLALAWLAALGSLWLAGGQGNAVLFLVAILAALAHSRMAVEKMSLAARLERLPGARAFVTAVGSTLTAAGPLLLADPAWRVGALAAPGYVFLFIVGKTLLRDLYDLDSDHLMGIETLPVLLGAQRARRLAKLILGIAGALPLLVLAETVVEGVTTPSGTALLALLAVIPWIGAVLLGRKDRRLGNLVFFQAALEAAGVAIGVAALLLGTGP